jgi:predicted transcriptional regulator
MNEPPIIDTLFQERDEAVRKLIAVAEENTILRAHVAVSNLPCLYCKLPREQLTECKQGPRDCTRMRDILRVPQERRNAFKFK